VVPAGAGLVPVNFTQKYNSNLGLTVNQIIFDPNYIVGLQASKTYKHFTNVVYTRSKIESKCKCNQGILPGTVSVEQLRLLDANIAELKQQVDETTARNKQGFVEKVDVDRITVQYNSLITSRENTIRLLALNYQLLNFKWVCQLKNELTLKEKLEDVKLDASSADAVKDTTV